MFELIIGTAQRDLFDGPGPGHRTYLASDGHHYTGIEAWDALYACSHPCATALTTDYPIRSTETVSDGWRRFDSFIQPGPDDRAVELRVYPLDADHPSDRPVRCSHCGAPMPDPS